MKNWDGAEWALFLTTLVGCLILIAIGFIYGWDSK